MKGVATVEQLERERQQRLKEAVAGELASDGKEERRDRLQRQISTFQAPLEKDAPQTCKSYAAAEAVIIKAMKSGAKFCDIRLDLTHQKLLVVPADVLRLGESLIHLSLVGNFLCELPTDLDLCRRLRVLNLSANELCSLPDLSELGELSHVGMSYNRVEDAGLPALCRALPRSLKSLDLSANELCDMEGFIDVFDDAFGGLQHLALKHNPLVLQRAYRSTLLAASIGAHLTVLDGDDVSAEMRASAIEESAARAASAVGDSAEEAAEAPATDDPPDAAATGAEGGTGGAEGGGAEGGGAAADGGEKRVCLRVTLTRVEGVPEVNGEGAGAPAAAPEAGTPEDGGENPHQLVVAFTVLDRKTETQPIARAPLVDLEDTSVEVVVPRSAALRDALLVHGVPFEVYALSPPPPPPDGADGADGADGSGGAPADGAADDADGAAAPTEKVLLGTVLSTWDPLLSGAAEFTQVCSTRVQPAAIAKKSRSGKRRSAGSKPPPPFTLSITASIEVVE